MYSFEGDFRSKPQQSLGGASRKLARDELLQKVAEERKNREESRRKTLAVFTIQAFFRGTLTRASEKNRLRNKFDENKISLEKMSPIDIQDALKSLLQQLIFFYSPSCDAQRLAWISQLYLKHNNLLAVCEPPEMSYRILNLLQLNLNALVSAVEQVPMAVPLRLLEIFTDPKTYQNSSTQATELFLQSIWRSLTRKGYYRHLKSVLEHRVPDSIEHSSRPPTPLAQSLYSLILRPLTIGGSQMFRVAMIRALLSDIFSEPLPPQIANFILLALSEENDLLPLADLLGALIDPNVDYQRPNSSQLAIQPTVWLLYSFLSLTCKKIYLLKGDIVVDYLQVLQCLAPKVQALKDHAFATENFDDDYDEEDAFDRSNEMETEDDLQTAVDESLSFLNEPQLVNAFCQAIEDTSLNEQCLASICSVCYTLLVSQRLAIHRFRLLYTLAFKSKFLRLLWRSIQQVTTVSTMPLISAPIPLLHLLSKGLPLSDGDIEFFLPQLIVFCSLFGHLLPTLHDDEFYKDCSGSSWGANQNTMPFTLDELLGISLTLRNVCLGWIVLAYPDTRPSLNSDYRQAMKNVGQSRELGLSDYLPDSEVRMWLRLFKEATGLLSQLYGRDSRRQFCPESHWIAPNIVMPVEKPCDLPLGNSRLNSYKPFMSSRIITREQIEDEGPPISITIVRYLKILQELPFVVSFPTRVKIFQALVSKNKQENQGEMYNFMMGPLIQVVIRRNYIYEDAFEKLSLENAPNLKLRMRIALVNVVGLDEAGIDGGGIFREFLSELLKTAFDPNRGFFKTTLDRMLYPNPGVALLLDNFPKHYHFIGRMLGKAIYENMLVELPFAAFFLAKMLGRHSGDVDILHLASLDPVIYKNLLYLKTFEGDVSDLGLDFTVMNSELGENQIVDLKHDGSSIPVTASNRIEYIHLVADYKLNKQIRAQCMAFKQGLANVIDLEWLRMFDPKELQVLISGAHIPVDVSDLKMHTNYAGGYSADHQVIKTFWKVVENFSEQQRRQLLKFVTSCSRPPLLGFKELAPAFCIQNAGSEPDRLPTASTCMNLLKLPEFLDERTLQSKLLYAIESGAGFELS